MKREHPARVIGEGVLMILFIGLLIVSYITWGPHR